MRNRPNRPQGVLPDPAAFPIGSVESRATARRLLEARRPLETLVYTDEYGWPIYEPGVRYAPAVVELPLAGKDMTAEEWISLYATKRVGPTDPVERERWLRQEQRKEEAARIETAVWMERHGLLDRGLCTLPPEQERIQREKQRAVQRAAEKAFGWRGR